MALHHQLPIYRDAYTLLGMLTKITRNVPRDLKRLLGEKLRDECIEILVLVFRANVHQDKSPYLRELIERVQVVELILRLSRDMKIISIPHYADTVALTQKIGKQATGATVDAGSLVETTNSYFGQCRQASASFHDRRRIARAALRRGHSINGDITKTFRRRTS